MTLQEMFDKAIAHFARMGKPSMYGGDCAYRDYGGNKCIVGAFIDDEHYQISLENKGVLEWDKTCKVTRKSQPVLNAVAASMGVEALSDDQGQLLYMLQRIHDDESDNFDIDVKSWYEQVKPYLIELAVDNGLALGVLKSDNPTLNETKNIESDWS